MKGQMETRASRLRASLVVLLAVAAVVAAVPAFAEPDNSYTVHPLVSNVPGAAVHLDPNLVNAWGLAAGPTSPWWVADNGTDVSTLYSPMDSSPILTSGWPSGPAAYLGFRRGSVATSAIGATRLSGGVSPHRSTECWRS